MKIIFIFSLAVAICGLVPTYAEDGFESIFDGKTLDGWNCRPSSQSKNWSVEKGQIIGRGKGQESYLMFNDQLGDFELRFSYKLISDEGNTGVEVRSHPVKGRASRLHGYHADIGHIGIGDKVLGAWDFHENNRGDYLAKRGHRVTINENGKKEIEEIDGAFEPSDAKEGDWNKVVVYAKGNRLWFTINGKIASEVIDNEEAKRLDKGYIGFQLHGGDKMVVAFKDISVKR
jgi:hypothetical protein